MFHWLLRVTCVGLVFGLSTQTASAIPVNGLISHWAADGSAVDSVDRNNGILMNGTTFGPGKIGEAFTLDGANDYIRIMGNPSLRPAQLTVAFWMNSDKFLDSSSFAVPFIFNLNEGDNEYKIVRGYDIFYTSGMLGIGLATSSGLRFVMDATMDIAPGEWHHIAGTYDKSALSLYFDGSLVASTPASFSIAYSPAPLLIGRVDFSFGSVPQPYFFGGAIDDVLLYGRALTSEEIRGLAAVPVPEPSTALLFAIGLVGVLGYSWQRKRAA